MSYAVTPLTDDELDQLDDFFYSDAVPEESLDLIGVHGLLCAISISPDPVNAEEWLTTIFDDQKPNWKDEQQQLQIEGLLKQFQKEIASNFYNDQEQDVPCELTIVPDTGEEISDLTAWCQAFMEGVFLREAHWMEGPQEELAAELLLPFMVVSDLFDEAEFTKMRKDKAICAAMCSQIPELLVDIYLMFHAPEK